MRVPLLRSVVVLLTFSAFSSGQSLPSPLGVLVRPLRKVEPPPEVRSALPPNSTVRLIADTQLAPAGEATVVYETGSGYDTDAHIAFVHAKEIQGHLELGNWAPVALSELSLDSKNRAVVAAFRNVGDGAATLFVLVRWKNDSYELVFQRLTQQGRLKIFQRGEGGLELMSAREDLDEDITCVWCLHRYEVERLEWDNGKFKVARRWVTRKTLDPYAVAERPIVLLEENP